MKIHSCLQGSAEWLRLRCGIPTSSQFDLILTKSGKPSASRERYLFNLLAERVQGKPIVEYVSMWMERGSALEEEAVQFYELSRDVITEPVGLVTNDEGTIGASPDRLVGDDGLLEIKVPAPHVHMSYLLKAGSAYEAYRCQVQGQLWITGRKWSDLLAWNPDFPPAIHRTERDEDFIATLSEAVESFSRLLENYCKQIMAEHPDWIKEWPLPTPEVFEQPETQPGLEAFISEDDVEFVKGLGSAEPPKLPQEPMGAGIPPAEGSSAEPAPPADPFSEPELPDYSQDYPPTCRACEGATELKDYGGKYPAKWRCKTCPPRTKGCVTDAAEWHKNPESQPQGAA